MLLEMGHLHFYEGTVWALHSREEIIYLPLLSYWSMVYYVLFTDNFLVLQWLVYIQISLHVVALASSKHPNWFLEHNSFRF